MFDNIFKQTSAEEKASALQQGSLFHTIEYELSGIVNKIKDIDNLNESEMKSIISRQHQMILNYDLFLGSNESRAQAQTLFTCKKFLQCFLDIIRTIELSQHEKICINKLAYDYYILPDKDNETSELLYQLCSEVNGREVLVLSGILGITEAKVLSMIRNSSFKEEKCIHRVNTYIVKTAKDLTLQNIVNIYCFLFDRFSNLFIYTMLESKPVYMTEIEEKRFDLISVAMLELLNSMSSNDMLRVLRDYEFTLNMVKQNITVRFALKTAVNFDRIISTIANNNLNVP